MADAAGAIEMPNEPQMSIVAAKKQQGALPMKNNQIEKTTFNRPNGYSGVNRMGNWKTRPAGDHWQAGCGGVDCLCFFTRGDQLLNQMP
jgi:hypothetical protein